MNTVSKVESALFRIMGTALGLGACTALIVNNPKGAVFTNIYGIIFFALFLSLGVYSAYSLIKPCNTKHPV
ncbi:hypothetical protein MNBD_NITROSPINAE01-1792 [hydrothermal vent metagenome]|uniref:Uncharacterized protein n=1 Tax=hydrothermal vent metagenome TaxID=652676 RepID=A0A3B1BRU6_9ZZZZ